MMCRRLSQRDDLVILSDSEGAKATEGESKDPEDAEQRL